MNRHSIICFPAIVARIVYYFCILGILAIFPLSAEATTLCAKKKQSVLGGKVKLGRAVIAVTAECPKGYTEVLDIETIQGDPGPQGDPGEDGSLRIYGDSSGGDLSLSSSVTFSAAQMIAQYDNFTVEAGQTLTLTSGAIIRCSGVFTNEGTIQVQVWQGAGRIRGTFSQVIPADAGIAARAAAFGEFGDNSTTRFGGQGGLALPTASAALLRYPGHRAGGLGSPHYPGSSNSVSSLSTSAGGAVTILAEGGFINNGSILANGTLAGPGSGGGAGGIVIVASPTSIANTGTISVTGGSGGGSDPRNGVGGGGGGGIVLLISPEITAGTVDINGGSAGTPGSAGSVSASPRMGGGGGGACGGDGGIGGSVSSSDDPNIGADGADGELFEIAADPTALF